MNRLEIKNRAKDLISGNLLKIWTPLIIVGLLSFLLTSTLGLMGLYENGVFTFPASIIVLIVEIPLVTGIIYYYLNFIRKKELDIKNIFHFYPQVVLIFFSTVLVSCFSFLWSLLFIIPGIIAAISYSFYLFKIADGAREPFDCINSSKQLLYGYKADYFVFNLSFTGWFIIGIFTFGIAYIWIIPYYAVSTCLYYEQLKEIKNN